MFLQRPPWERQWLGGIYPTTALMKKTRGLRAGTRYAESLGYHLQSRGAAALQPLKLRTHAWFPDSLFCILGHAHRIAGCKRCILVV